jgi:hypothetical protein
VLVHFPKKKLAVEKKEKKLKHFFKTFCLLFAYKTKNWPFRSQRRRPSKAKRTKGENKLNN